MESINRIQLSKANNINSLFNKLRLQSAAEYIFPILNSALRSFDYRDMAKAMKAITYAISVTNQEADIWILKAIRYELHYILED